MPNEHSRAPERLEPPSVATRAVLLSGLGLLLLVATSLVVMHFYYRATVQRRVFVPPTPFAQPRLQTSEKSELAALQASQRSALQSYAWVDRDKGIIAIPIDEAMRRIAERPGDKYAPVEAVEPDGTTSEETKR